MKKKTKKTSAPQIQNPPELRVIDAWEASALVIKEVKFIGDHLCEVLKDINKQQRWMLHGRITQGLFGNHFQLSMNVANEMQEKKELTKHA